MTRARLVRAASGDSERSGELLQRCRSLAGECEMPRLVARAEELAQRAGA